MPSRALMRMQWKLHKALWKVSGGRLGRKVVGMPVMELVTTGHRSGELRAVLITYVLDGGRPAVIGTNAGAQHDPAWAKNLRAQPACRIRRDGTWHDATGEFLDGDDHQRVWDVAVAINKSYTDYLTTASRPIPIVRFSER